MDCVNEVSDAAWFKLHDVCVLGVARGRGDVGFVKRRTSAKGNRVCDRLAGKHLRKRAGDEEVLLDEMSVAPRREALSTVYYVLA